MKGNFAFETCNIQLMSVMFCVKSEPYLMKVEFLTQNIFEDHVIPNACYSSVHSQNLEVDGYKISMEMTYGPYNDNQSYWSKLLLKVS